MESSARTEIPASEKNMGCGFAEFNAEIITHFLCKRPACGAGKNSYDTVG